jgi:PKD repeat protein
MRNLLLLLPLAGLSLATSAQERLMDSKLTKKMQDNPVVITNNQSPKQNPYINYSSSRAGNPATLNSQRIGSAGNLLTVIEGANNQIDVNDSLDAVIFIHRNDPFISPGTNVAQYRYDVSKDRGATWTSNIGPITNDIDIDNVSVNGRFPEALIYNPAGNTNVDSAYLIYAGTYHTGSSGRWYGDLRGRGKLSGDTATFNVNIDPINGGIVSIGRGLTKGAPGVFWRVVDANTATFATGSNAISNGLVVLKGTWDVNTKDVVWTEQLINQAFATFDNSGTTVSASTAQNIAFDPTGQYGWVAVLGDITPGTAEAVYDPIFWKTTDFGANWTGPFFVDLDSVQGIREELATELINGDPASGILTATFQADLQVDVNGNPHYLITTGNGGDYTVEAAGYDMWDITFDPSAQVGCNWKGIHLANINTLRGDFSSDNPASTEDNRPLISRSADGHKLFFFWNESDFEVVQGNDNSIPNLFAKAIDVVALSSTPVYNLTAGDTLWGGETVDFSGGVFGGSIYPQVSPTALENGYVYNIPTIFTQIDYNNDPSQGLGSSEQPAAFWYVSNINFPAADFTLSLDQTPPTITLNGADTVTLLVGSTYTEDGATAFDCTDGTITPTIQGAPNVNVVGVYNVLYIATDVAGNSDTAVRVVIIGATPVADFTWSFTTFSYRPNFQDLSINIPTQWTWAFGDNTGSVSQNPIKTYTTNGSYNVCLTAKNSFGTSAQVCKTVSITGVGIEDIEFASQINMFPNPTSDKVRLGFEGNVTPELTVSVINTLGAVVIAPATYTAGTTSIELNTSTLANGIYFVKIGSDKGAAVKQLSVQHK